ncbi:hypothetical protein AVEN_235078-1, partial [Araneus ventricosus]
AISVVARGGINAPGAMKKKVIAASFLMADDDLGRTNAVMSQVPDILATPLGAI